MKRKKKIGYIDPNADYTDPKTGVSYSVDGDGVLNPIDPIGPAPVDNTTDIPMPTDSGTVYTASPTTMPQMETVADPVTTTTQKKLNWPLIIALVALGYFITKKK